MKSKGQKDLNQYIFTRPEMARLLNISTNALRMRMKKGKCDLEYRFNGQKFLFMRPRADMVNGPPKTTKEDSHEKTLDCTTGKSKRGTIEGQHMGTMGENQFARENTLSKALNTIMR